MEVRGKQKRGWGGGYNGENPRFFTWNLPLVEHQKPRSPIPHADHVAAHGFPRMLLVKSDDFVWNQYSAARFHYYVIARGRSFSLSPDNVRISIHISPSVHFTITETMISNKIFVPPLPRFEFRSNSIRSYFLNREWKSRVAFIVNEWN